MGVCGQSTQTGLVLASGPGEMDRRAGNTMNIGVLIVILIWLRCFLLVLFYQTHFLWNICWTQKGSLQKFLKRDNIVLWNCLEMHLKHHQLCDLLLFFSFFPASGKSWNLCFFWRSWARREYQREMSRLILCLHLLAIKSVVDNEIF